MNAAPFFLVLTATGRTPLALQKEFLIN